MRFKATCGNIVSGAANSKIVRPNPKKVARRPNRSARNLLFAMAAQEN